MVNLTHDWLSSLLPFLLGKIDRVTFGLLSADDLARALSLDPSVSKSRRLLAVPFLGKDVPSFSSEFSHPDVRIGLSILAYRYEGMRMTDFTHVMKTLREDCEDESGPFFKRRSCQQFIRWVELAGGRVRGIKRRAGLPATPPMPHQQPRA